MSAKYYELTVGICLKKLHLSKVGTFASRFAFFSVSDLKDKKLTRSQAVARIADRTAKNCRGQVTHVI